MIEFNNGSIIAVHDIFDTLPKFMHSADTVFVDIPYTQGMLTNYLYRDCVRTSEKNTFKLNDFLYRLFECIQIIAPNTLFVECGKTSLPFVFTASDKIYKYVTFYNSTYYHNTKNKAYIIHATNTYKAKNYKLDDLDEDDIMRWICKNHNYNVIGDLCIGKGAIGRYATLNNKVFVGTEINPDRLRHLTNWMKKNGHCVVNNNLHKGA